MGIRVGRSFRSLSWIHLDDLQGPVRLHVLSFSQGPAGTSLCSKTLELSRACREIRTAVRAGEPSHACRIADGAGNRRDPCGRHDHAAGRVESQPTLQSDHIGQHRFSVRSTRQRRARLRPALDQRLWSAQRATTGLSSCTASPSQKHPFCLGRLHFRNARANFGLLPHDQVVANLHVEKARATCNARGPQTLPKRT